MGVWRKPPQETEKSARWANITYNEGGALTTGSMGPGRAQAGRA